MYIEEDDGWHLKTHDTNGDSYIFSFGCDYGSQVTIYPNNQLWEFNISYADGEYTLTESKSYSTLEEAKNAALQFLITLEEERSKRFKYMLAGTVDYIDKETKDLMNKLVRLANTERDGHMTIMKFTTHWKVMLGTPELNYDEVRKLRPEKTLKEAIIKVMPHSEG